MKDNSLKVGFIGGGNMAQAIAFGMCQNRVLNAKNIVVSDPNTDLHNIFSEKDIFFTTDNFDVVNTSDIIFLAVKPQIIDNVLDQIKSFKIDLDDKCFVTIAPSISTDYIINSINAKNVVRIMPNTPLLVSCGASAICFDKCNNESFKSFITQTFGLLGSYSIVKEDVINAIVSVNGSSPAYFYYFLNSIIKSAVGQGIDESVARKLAAQTMLGSAKMILSSEKNIDDLIDAVCSKGGTTIEAVNVLKNNNVDKIIDKAMKACTNRANELAK